MRWLASNSFTFKEAIKSSINSCSLSFTSDVGVQVIVPVESPLFDSPFTVLPVPVPAAVLR